MQIRHTNYIGNGCFCEARRDDYDGLISPTGIVYYSFNIITVIVLVLNIMC